MGKDFDEPGTTDWMRVPAPSAMIYLAAEAPVTVPAAPMVRLLFNREIFPAVKASVLFTVALLATVVRPEALLIVRLLNAPVEEMDWSPVPLSCMVVPVLVKVPLVIFQFPPMRWVRLPPAKVPLLKLKSFRTVSPAAGVLVPLAEMVRLP